MLSFDDGYLEAGEEMIDPFMFTFGAGRTQSLRAEYARVMSCMCYVRVNRTIAAGAHEYL